MSEEQHHQWNHNGDDEVQVVDGSQNDGKPMPHLPRVKLLVMSEYEYFLHGVIEALEQSGCCHYPTATSTNPWATAFRLTYEGVASDCHLPTGKNRYHKFKGKMEDLWAAMEVQVVEGTKNRQTDPIYDMAMNQLAAFRQSRENLKAGIKPPSAGEGGQEPVVVRGVAMAASSPTPPSHHSHSAHPTTAHKPSARHPAPHPHPPAPVVGGGGGMMLDQRTVRHFQACLVKLEGLLNRALLMPPPAPIGPPAMPRPLKLPSPLQELATLKMRTTSNREERDMMDPYYKEALNRFLEQVNKQINTAPPPLLWTFLDGLDVLRQIVDADQERVQTVYRRVMVKYLECVATPGPPRKKPRHHLDVVAEGAAMSPSKQKANV